MFSKQLLTTSFNTDYTTQTVLDIGNRDFSFKERDQGHELLPD